MFDRKSLLGSVSLLGRQLCVKGIWAKCRWSMIMSVVNWSGKMSVWRDESETDIERKRAEAVGGIE